MAEAEFRKEQKKGIEKKRAGFGEREITDSSITKKLAYSGKRVYFPQAGDELGTKRQAKNTLGGKGAGLAEMISLGLPVPPVITIPTTEGEKYMKERTVDEGLWNDIREGVKALEEKTGKKFFDFKEGDEILLLSGRSGAPVSMPGMMDTVLNIGLNDERVQLLLKTEDPKFVLDTYRRFIQYYGSTVLGVDAEKFEKVLGEVKRDAGVKLDTELKPKDLEDLITLYKWILNSGGKSIPNDPFEQLKAVVQTVFESSASERATAYKKANNIPENMSTAVNIQAMVYGNRNEQSGSGVLFTRDKATGEAKTKGEFLRNSQGEEVVSGVRTPEDFEAFKKQFPELADRVEQYARLLEKHYKDMQDIEFTVDNGELFMLQTRSGKRGGEAAFRIAHDLVKEGVIDKRTAVSRIEEDHIVHVLKPQLDPKRELHPVAAGISASRGAGTGIVVFDSKEADRIVSENPKTKVILLKKVTSPDDFAGMIAAGRSGGGVLTAEGGATSHAAVVCGGNGIPAVVGCQAIKIDEQNRTATINGMTVKAGDWLTIDGTTGNVYIGKKTLTDPKLTPEAIEVLKWADRIAKLKVLANADTPWEAETARGFGAQGIGLCRTEHMFRDGERLAMVRKMIMASAETSRREALAPLLELQRGDFEGIFKAMSGLPVTIRLIDPPLHEFLPKIEKLIQAKTVGDVIEALDKGLETDRLAESVGKEFSEKLKSKEGRAEIRLLLEKVSSLHEENPMMGLRGVRLTLVYPEILEMQARAILEAAVNVSKEGFEPVVKIMVPIVALESEFVEAKRIIDKVAQQVMEEKDVKIPYLVGTMIEIPSAALIAGKIARSADFFSFGTNDLTQMTFGFSRDDAGVFLKAYEGNRILETDPFKHLHPTVAELMSIAVKRGRGTNPELGISICGEHGGDMQTIKETLEPMRRRVGFDAVSCSPFRVPIARMAAAQAAIAE